jgi:hypothetical protein
MKVPPIRLSARRCLRSRPVRRHSTNLNDPTRRRTLRRRVARRRSSGCAAQTRQHQALRVALTRTARDALRDVRCNAIATTAAGVTCGSHRTNAKSPARPLRVARRDFGITRFSVQGSRSSTQRGEETSKNRGPVAHPRAVPSRARFHCGQRLPAVSRSCFGGRLLGTTAVERSGSGRCTWLHPEAEELGWKLEDQ